MILLLVCVVLFVVAAAFVSYRSFFVPPVRRRVLVNLRDGDLEAFRGVLWRRRGSWLVLRHAEVVTRAEATPVEGEVLIGRERILFLQYID